MNKLMVESKMSTISSNPDGSNPPEESKPICISQKDLQMLYMMEGETLKGLIYEPDESEYLMLVFDKHTLNISGDGSVLVEERK